MKKIQVRLCKSWGNFSAGDDVLFDENKGREIIIGGYGVEVKRTMKENPINKKRRPRVKIKIKLVKQWGGRPVGAEVMFDESKGYEIIAAGIGVEVEKKPKKPKKIEVAMIDPAAETAEAPPIIKKSRKKKGGKNVSIIK